MSKARTASHHPSLCAPAADPKSQEQTELLKLPLEGVHIVRKCRTSDWWKSCPKARLCDIGQQDSRGLRTNRCSLQQRGLSRSKAGFPTPRRSPDRPGATIGLPCACYVNVPSRQAPSCHDRGRRHEANKNLSFSKGALSLNLHRLNC